jgi:hypothetical protein
VTKLILQENPTTYQGLAAKSSKHGHFSFQGPFLTLQPRIGFVLHFNYQNLLRVRNTPCRLGQIYLDLTKALQGGV